MVPGEGALAAALVPEQFWDVKPGLWWAVVLLLWGRRFSTTSWGCRGSAGKVLVNRFVIPLKPPFLSPKEKQELKLAYPIYALLFSKELNWCCQGVIN